MERRSWLRPRLPCRAVGLVEPKNDRSRAHGTGDLAATLRAIRKVASGIGGLVDEPVLLEPMTRELYSLHFGAPIAPELQDAANGVAGGADKRAMRGTTKLDSSQGR